MPLKAEGRLLTLVPAGDPLIGVTRDFVGVSQLGHSLCWAACVESALASLPNRKKVSQSRLARQFIRSCRTPYRGRTIRNTRCDKAIPAQEMASVWRHAGFSGAELIEVPDDLGSFLVNELYRKGPLQAWVDRFHGVMIYGFREKANGKQKVLTMDPQPGIGDGWRSLRGSSKWSAIWSNLHA